METWRIHRNTSRLASFISNKNMSLPGHKELRRGYEKSKGASDYLWSFVPQSDTQSVYATNSVPPKLLSWVKSNLAPPGSCESNPNALMTSCCWSSCGGMADRVRGLAALLMIAEYTSRPLCLSKDYFLAAPRPACEPNSSFVLIEPRGFRLYTDASVEASAVRSPRIGDRFFKHPELRKVRYISTNMMPNLTQSSGLSSLVEAGTISASQLQRFSVMALLVSRVLEDEMAKARRAISATVGLYSKNDSFVSLHVRCGGSKFSISTGHELSKTTTVDNKFVKAHIVPFLRRPMTLVCQLRASLTDAFSCYFVSHCQL